MELRFRTRSNLDFANHPMLEDAEQSTRARLSVPGEISFINGDGHADVSVFRLRTGQWCFVECTSAGAIRLAGDIPVPGYYNV